MDIGFLKSFLPEIFFSAAIFFQLIFNSRFINTVKFNYPIIYKENFYQSLGIFVCLILLFFNLKVEGFFSNFLFLNDLGGRLLKMILIFFSTFTLFFIGRSFCLQNINFFEYFSVFLLSLLALLLLIDASDILSAYLIIEMQALCFYVLASFKRDSSFSTEAGLKYFISGSFISGVFLLGAALIYGCLGTLNFNILNWLLTFNSFSDFESLKILTLIGILLVTFTLLFKVAAAPFHFWSPDVYEGSPLSSTIIFSVIPKISLFVFFFRWVLAVSTCFLDFNFLFVLVGILSVFFGTFFAIRQKRVKRLVIYSSIAQVGFLIAPFFALSIDSFSYVIFFLFIYLITSILVWGNLVSFYNSFNSFKNFLLKIPQTFFISNLAGLSKVNKLNALSFIVIFFSISGIPPFSGFLAKIFVFLSLLDLEMFLGAFFLILINMVSVYYYIRIIKIVFFEVKKVNTNNLEFQMTYPTYNQDVTSLILAGLLMSLLLVFVYPTFFYLISHYVILGLENNFYITL
jgi:NADH-quinone oxidoreductase subunit N